MFDRICILGPGLLGASIALAAKQRQLTRCVSTWSRRAETRAKCRNQSWCDAVAETPQEAVRDAELIVICTPVATIVPLLASVAPAITSNALITDVGSTKSLICDEADKVELAHGCFIGSHPMAGSDQTGMENARADLFEGAVCFTTPQDPNSEAEHQRLQAFWQALGMRVHTTTPAEHDAIAAQVSHLPHLLASALCVHLGEACPSWRPFSGTGLRDTTRIAAGDPSLWHDIFRQNRTSVLKALTEYEATLKKARQVIEQSDGANLYAFLEAGRHFRQQLDKTTPTQTES